jgi:antitoxin ParD1/3/4
VIIQLNYQLFLECLMSNSLNLSLTDELRAFVDRNTGDGSLYATPSEFLRSLLREKKERMEAQQLRTNIVSGYQDAIAGRTTKFSGDLNADLDQFLSN